MSMFVKVRNSFLDIIMLIGSLLCMKETCEVVHKPFRSKDKNDKGLTS